MSNIQFQENRAYARNVVGAPAYNNRWSNNWLEKRVPSTTFYAAFPSANYKNSTNLVGSCNYVPATNYKATTSTVAARAPVFSPKANDDDDDNDNNNNKLIAFHSSNRWKEYFQASKHSNKLVSHNYKTTTNYYSTFICSCYLFALSKSVKYVKQLCNSYLPFESKELNNSELTLDAILCPYFTTTCSVIAEIYFCFDFFFSFRVNVNIN